MEQGKSKLGGCGQVILLFVGLIILGLIFQQYESCNKKKAETQTSINQYFHTQPSTLDKEQDSLKIKKTIAHNRKYKKIYKKLVGKSTSLEYGTLRLNDNRSNEGLEYECEWIFSGVVSKQGKWKYRPETQDIYIVLFGNTGNFEYNKDIEDF